MYNQDDLCLSLAQNLDLTNIQGYANGRPIKLAADASHLEIDPTFEEAIFDLRNHRIAPQFCDNYPNLAQYVNSSKSADYSRSQ